jgi:hypothetical protein
MLLLVASSSAIWDLVRAFAIIQSVCFWLLIIVVDRRIKAAQEPRAKKKPYFY